MKDYIEWDKVLELIYNLIENERYSLAMFVLVAVNTGYRVEKIRRLRWINILDINDISSNGVTIHLNEDFYAISKYIYKIIGNPPLTEYILLSNKKTPYSTQRINILLKELNVEFNLGVEKLTTHSFRKTFGRRIVEQSKNSYAALCSLARYFNHASVGITLDYLSLEEYKEKISHVIGIKNDGRFGYLKEKNSDKPKKNKAGYVYFMIDEIYPEYTKIGNSETPIIREKTLSHTVPKISLLKLKKTNDKFKLERELHKRFKNKNARGEWFKGLTKEEINEACEIYGFVDAKEYLHYEKI